MSECGRSSGELRLDRNSTTTSRAARLTSTIGLSWEWPRNKLSRSIEAPRSWSRQRDSSSNMLVLVIAWIRASASLRCRSSGMVPATARAWPSSVALRARSVRASRAASVASASLRYRSSGMAPPRPGPARQRRIFRDSVGQPLREPGQLLPLIEAIPPVPGRRGRRPPPGQGVRRPGLWPRHVPCPGGGRRGSVWSSSAAVSHTARGRASTGMWGQAIALLHWFRRLRLR